MRFRMTIVIAALRQRAVDRRYGRGVVQLSSALQPVSSS
jgi:hypothetical protein